MHSAMLVVLNEVIGMQINTSKTESMVFLSTRMACLLQVGGVDLPRMEQFMCLRILFTTDGKTDVEISHRFDRQP